MAVSHSALEANISIIEIIVLKVSKIETNLVFVKNKIPCSYKRKVIGANLKRLRLRDGLSQADVAKVIDVTLQQIQKYEAGTNRLPVDSFLELKKFFGVPYEDFFDGL